MLTVVLSFFKKALEHLDYISTGGTLIDTLGNKHFYVIMEISTILAPSVLHCYITPQTSWVYLLTVLQVSNLDYCSWAVHLPELSNAAAVIWELDSR